MTHSADSASKFAPTIGAISRVWIVTLGAGLVAAMITWAAGESMMIEETGMGSRGGRTRISPVVYATRNGMISFGLLGGSLGLSLGLAGGLLRGSARSAGLAGLVGVLMGGAFGAVAARILVPFYFGNSSGANLGLPMLVHGGLWTFISIAAGLAFGLGIGGPGRLVEAVIYAIVGAMLATLTYEVGGVFGCSRRRSPTGRSRSHQAAECLSIW
jgi:hypothetical protein